MKNVLIDTDPGMDDALAIALALRSRTLRTLAVTAATGNLPSDRTAANALRVLDLLGREDIPVGQGPLLPLDGDYPVDPFSHGSDGLAESHFPASTRALDPRPAPQVIAETVAAHAGDISIAALAPLTNLALALEIDPRLPEKVTELVIIGGSYGLTPYAWSQATGDNAVSEWNVFVDPEAAHRVFNAGFNLTAVGLDIATHPRINFRPRDLERLRAARTPEAALAVRIVEYVQGRGYQSYCSLIDSVAVAALIDPTLVTSVELRCAVERRGELTRGMTVVERRAHHGRTDLPVIRAVSDLDFDRFLDLVTGVLSDDRT
ncbi:nucleoside hydrolase [Streptomyces sp. NPDC059477]|uniref:nucleoside hydrolase n=1 Tax=Streptomyces sp. NPDC059477 TaxID=3346847 RepID=UPI0036C666E2